MRLGRHCPCCVYLLDYVVAVMLGCCWGTDDDVKDSTFDSVLNRFYDTSDNWAIGDEGIGCCVDCRGTASSKSSFHTVAPLQRVVSFS